MSIVLPQTYPQTRAQVQLWCNDLNRSQHDDVNKQIGDYLDTLQPLLLGYYYPVDTPGTPTAPDSNHAQYSDIFILNNAYEIVGFNVGTRDFIPKNWVASTSYTAGLSKVMHSGIEYLCTTSNSDSTFNSAHWSNLGAPPANYILTSGVVTKDIGDTIDYPIWSSVDYRAGQAVNYDNFVYVCIVNTVNQEVPTDQTYWFKIDGIGYLNPFLIGDNFTVYLPSAVYANTNDSEVNNFIRPLAYAGVQWNIKTY